MDIVCYETYVLKCFSETKECLIGDACMELML